MARHEIEMSNQDSKNGYSKNGYARHGPTTAKKFSDRFNLSKSRDTDSPDPATSSIVGKQPFVPNHGNKLTTKIYAPGRESYKDNPNPTHAAGQRLEDDNSQSSLKGRGDYGVWMSQDVTIEVEEGEHHSTTSASLPHAYQPEVPHGYQPNGYHVHGKSSDGIA